LITLHRVGFGEVVSTTHEVPRSLIARGNLNALLIDRKGRLWLGRDSGEWGGSCAMLDLQSGKASLLDAPDGVYGFVELRDGQVWTYGGTMHLGLCTGSIARVDRGLRERLGSYALDERSEQEVRPTEPRYPITHMIAVPGMDGLVVFAYRDVFYVHA